MNENDVNPLESKFEKIAASLTCPVLRENYKKLSRSDFYKQYADAFIRPNFAENFQQLLSSDEALKSIIIDCYSNCSETLQGTFEITPDKYALLIEVLEPASSIYILLSTQHGARVSMKSMAELASGLVEQLDQATVGWDESLDLYETLFLTISSNEKKSKHYSEAIKSLVEAREELRSLPSFIKNAQVSKMIELGKRAQPTNTGLQFWVEHVYLIWVTIMERSIENKNDGINGRKHLLNFMEALMLPIHEAVEYSTLDNMLRKVQEDVKARGGFNHSNFEVGASSPLSVGWSNQES